MTVRAVIRPAFIAPALCLLYALTLVLLANDPFVLVTVGEAFAPPELRDHSYSPAGYDGQFTYYLARYGLDARPYLDVPAYRAQRILLPFVARLLSSGEPATLIWLLLCLNAGGLALGTYCLERLLEGRLASRWFALSAALSLGMFGGVRMATTEPFAYGLAVAGLYLADRRHWWSAGAMFAFAALARETTLLFPVAFTVALFVSRVPPNIAGAARMLLPSCVTFLVWQVALYKTYGTFGVGSGGADTTGFEWVPFGGYVRPIWESLARGDAAAATAVASLMGAFVVYPAIWSLRQIGGRLRQVGAWSLAEWLLLLHVLVISLAPASTFAEPLGMLRLITGFQIAVVLVAAEHRRSHALRYSLLWGCTTIVLVTADLHSVLR